MERALQLAAALNLGALGLSHILRPQVWADYFIRLREQGEAAAFAVAMPTLAAGAVIVAFHDVWTGLPLVLTLYGWALVAKGVLYLLAPSVGLRSLNRVSRERSRGFIAPGVFLVAVAALLAVHLVRTGGA